MPDVERALLSFGRLIGLLNQGEAVQWLWFGDPLPNALQGVSDNRSELGKITRALLDLNAAGVDQPFLESLNLGESGTLVLGESETLVWEPIGVGPAGAGLVWNVSGPLRLGFGVKFDSEAGQQAINLVVLARLLEVKNKQLSSELGHILFSGGFPVPEFLTSGSLLGSITPPKISLTVAAGNGSRELKLASDWLAWDCVRLAMFVVQAWVHHEAAGSGDGFFYRVNRHLFPMLGAAADEEPIRALPVFQDMPVEPEFDSWKKDVLSTDNNAAGALIFLWHLRALLTGNESSEFLDGSYFFPLVGDPSAGGASGNTTPPVDGGHTGTLEVDEVGAFIGIITEGDTHSLVLDIRRSETEKIKITLAQNEAGTLQRPQVPSWAELKNFMESLQAEPFAIGSEDGPEKLTASPIEGEDGWLLTFVNEEVAATGLKGFDGAYKLRLVFKPDEPIGYRFESPSLNLDLPPTGGPDPAKKMFAAIAQWILSALPADQAGEIAKVTAGLGEFISDTLNGKAPNAAALLATLWDVMEAETPSSTLPVSVTIANGQIKPTLTLGPFDGLGAYIGKLKATADLTLTAGAQSPMQSLELALTDLRLGKKGGAVPSGLVGSLIPDLKQVPGFFIALNWDAQKGVTLEGGGKIPIQRTLGPLEIASLLVDLRQDSVSVGIDLAFQLAIIRITAYELGLRFPFKSGTPEAFLHGLGIACDASGIKLAGMFAEVTKPDKSSDYVGGAVVSVAGMFELSAIGGYTQPNSGTSSLFIFASLRAPLGGPPWMFITGVAGGFGYNRSLPPAGLLTQHPFLRVMSGEIGLGDGDSAAALVKLSDYFAPLEGQHWIAAGIEFVSFGFITGQLVVAIGFGHDFSISVFGFAAFSIKPIAHFELSLEATGDKESFRLQASLSPACYIIHPELFSLRGDFGLGIWYAGKHVGDFVVSIGGYHPYLPDVGHYPKLSRVGVKTVVYGFIRMSVECFFACTPQALMAGASMSLSAEFAGIGAGLDVYADVFIRWDPFFLQARLGVVVWFEFFGRHEIGVEIEVHTPSFGGLAHVDLEVISFDIAFGEPLAVKSEPKLHEFLTRQLGVPAKKWNTHGAKVATFNTKDAAGLIRVEFLFGRATKDQPTKSPAQEGVDTPVAVDAEFSFSVRTNLPLNVVDLNLEAPPPAKITGEVSLPLCDKLNLESILEVQATQISTTTRGWLTDHFPAANFGSELLPTVQAGQLGARQAVGQANQKPAVVQLVDGITFSYVATPQPVNAKVLTALPNEDSLPEEEYPLPLAWPKSIGQIFSNPTSSLVRGAVPTAVTLGQRLSPMNRRASALQRLAARVPAPLHILLRSADVQRSVVTTRLRSLTVAAPPADAVVMGPPPSPARRSELFPVNLRVLPTRAPGAVARKRLEALSPARNLSSHSMTPPQGVFGRFDGMVTVAAGQAVHLTIIADRNRRTVLKFAGNQTVRAIFLGGAGDPIADLYVTGNRTISAPIRARRVILIGEGFEPAVASDPTTPAALPMAQESIGVEHDTVLLALGTRVYAGHGCLLKANTPLSCTPQPLDSVPGHMVLRTAVNFRMHFPAVPSDWNLILAVVPTVAADPSSAVDQIRWLSLDAELRSLNTVIGPDATTFVMTVETKQPWSLDVDLGPQWRLTGVAVSRRQVLDVTPRLRADRSWEVIDDRFSPPPPGTSTTVTLEVA